MIEACPRPRLIVCDRDGLLDAALAASPPYLATMLCFPTVRAFVVQAALRVLPVPVRAIAEQPLIELAPSLKSTLPVGALPVTLAVNVTLAPEADGLAELVSVVVVVVTAVMT